MPEISDELLDRLAEAIDSCDSLLAAAKLSGRPETHVEGLRFGV